MNTINDAYSFQNIFSGNTDFYGKHIPEKEKDKKGKRKGKSFTVKKQLELSSYQKHLNGEEGLGIVPLTKDGKVKFVAIDIDNYNENYVKQIVDKVYKNNLPFLPFKSKSGGLHLYMFFEKLHEYSSISKQIKEFIPVLGIDKNVEIFPKQLKLSEGQVGNWINLPYFNSKKTNQYLISKNYEPVSLSAAIMEINNKKINPENINNIVESLFLFDAPPCLQTIFYNRTVHMRNEYLFNLAVYLKSKNEESFEYELLEYNNFLLEPLPIKEISDTTIKSHKKKDYSYRCKNQPLCDVCIKTLCKLRKYGIGGNEISELSFEDFIQHKADPPYYEWIINGVSLTFFSETDIISQGRFRELCFRELHILPVRLKDITWTKIINRALQNIVIVEINPEEDMSPGSIFMNYLHEFLEKRVFAENLSQILIDRVYRDEKEMMYVFRGQFLIDFLFNNKGFRYFRVTEIQSRVKKMGGINTRIYIDKNNKGVRIWKLPFKTISNFKTNPEIGFGLDLSKIGDANEEAY
jgi:hypothetical protein